MSFVRIAKNQVQHIAWLQADLQANESVVNNLDLQPAEREKIMNIIKQVNVDLTGLLARAKDAEYYKTWKKHYRELQIDLHIHIRQNPQGKPYEMKIGLSKDKIYLSSVEEQKAQLNVLQNWKIDQMCRQKNLESEVELGITAITPSFTAMVDTFNLLTTPKKSSLT